MLLLVTGRSCDQLVRAGERVTARQREQMKESTCVCVMLCVQIKCSGPGKREGEGEGGNKGRVCSIVRRKFSSGQLDSLSACLYISRALFQLFSGCVEQSK